MRDRGELKLRISPPFCLRPKEGVGGSSPSEAASNLNLSSRNDLRFFGKFPLAASNNRLIIERRTRRPTTWFEFRFIADAYQLEGHRARCRIDSLGLLGHRFRSWDS